MFAQFRERYPEGSIVTDMLPKADGMYVFRATIRHGDIVLATATATDRDLETAEDRAIERALTIAGISYNARLSSTAVLSAARFESRLESRRDTYELPASNGTLSLPNGRTLEPLPDVYPLSDDRDRMLCAPPPPVEPPLPATAHSDRPLPEAPSLAPEPLPEFEPMAVPASSDRASGAKRKPAASSPAPTPSTLPVAAPEPSPEPVDLSEYIAQIGVEMERAGWSTKRGRDYLLTTFGKKSRAELTEEEMQRFLAHLKAQP